MSETQEEMRSRLERACAWCEEQLVLRRPDYWAHSSHLISEILEEADSKFVLESYGVEGMIAPDLMYLNAGDTYTQTLLCLEGEFLVTDYGTALEDWWADYDCKEDGEDLGEWLDANQQDTNYER